MSHVPGLRRILPVVLACAVVSASLPPTAAGGPTDPPFGPLKYVACHTGAAPCTHPSKWNPDVLEGDGSGSGRSDGPVSLVDLDGDGTPNAEEAVRGSHPLHASSTPGSDDDGDGTDNQNESSTLQSGAWGVVARPDAGYPPPKEGLVASDGVALGSAGDVWVWDGVCAAAWGGNRSLCRDQRGDDTPLKEPGGGIPSAPPVLLREDFSGDALDGDTWRTPCGWGVQVQDGILHLHDRREHVHWNGWTHVHRREDCILSNSTFPGKVEIRIRIRLGSKDRSGLLYHDGDHGYVGFGPSMENGYQWASRPTGLPSTVPALERVTDGERSAVDRGTRSLSTEWTTLVLRRWSRHVQTSFRTDTLQAEDLRFLDSGQLWIDGGHDVEVDWIEVREFQPGPDVLEHQRMLTDGYGWRRVADALPAEVTTTAPTPTGDADGDGVPTFRICQRNVTVHPDGTVSRGEPTDCGPSRGDPRDDDPTFPLPAVEGLHADVQPGACGLDSVQLAQVGARVAWNGETYGTVHEDDCRDAGALPVTVPYPSGVETGRDTDGDGLPRDAQLVWSQVTVTEDGGVVGPEPSDRRGPVVALDPDDRRAETDRVQEAAEDPAGFVNSTVDRIRARLEDPLGDENGHETFLPTAARFPEPAGGTAGTGPLPEPGTGGILPGPDGIGPVERTGAQAPVLAGDDLTGLDATSYAIDDRAFRLEPAAEPPSRVLVEIPWLGSHLGVFGADAAFAVVEHDGRRFAEIEDPAALAGDEAAFFNTTLGSSAYTLGDPDRIEVRERAMNVTLEETPGETRTNVTLDTPNGTVHETRRSWHGRLVVDLNGTNTSGQPVAFDRDWLHDLGIDDPVFLHEDGSRIPVEARPLRYVLHPDHFSDVVVADDGCDGFYQRNDEPYSDVRWVAREGLGDCWDGSDTLKTLSDRRDPDDERASAVLMGTDDGTQPFRLTSTWTVDRQGNWQGAFPLFYGGEEVTDPHQDPNVAYVYYASHDDDGGTPSYHLRYRDESGVLRIDRAWSAPEATGSYRFEIRYETATEELTLEIQEPDGDTLESASYRVGSHTGDGFAFQQIGTAADGRDGSDESTTKAWADDFVLHDDPPTADLDAAPRTGTTGDEFTFDASGSTDDFTYPSNLEARFDWTADGYYDTGWSTDKTQSHRFDTGGEKLVRVQVRDRGHRSDTATTTVEVDDPPDACFNVQDPPSASQPASFDASCSADDRTATSNLEVRWDWTDDGSWDSDWSTDKTASHVYGSPGTYTARAIVRDGSGQTDTTTRQVTVSDRPDACFDVSPALVDPGEEVHVDASCSSDRETSTADLRVRWDWESDGSWDTGWSTTKTADHAYSSSGDKRIKLQVRDDHGRVDTAAEQVTVTEPPEACLDVDPGTGNTETRFTFDASCVTDDRTDAQDLQVRFDLQGDGSWERGWSTDKTAAGEYAAADLHEATVQVRDADGLVDRAVVQVPVSDQNADLELTGPSVSPSRGTTDTRHTFSVTYTDPDNNPPEHVRVHVADQVLDLEPWNASDADYTDGNLYTLTTTLPAGKHTTVFEAHDGYAGRLTAPRDRPDVEPYAHLVDDGEEHTEDWVATGLWHRSTKGADDHANPFSGDTSWWFGDDASGGTRDGAPGGTLTSPWIDLRDAPGPVVLGFLSWYDTSLEGDAADTKRVLVRREGQTWPDARVVENVTGPRDRGTWHPRVADLTDLTGHKVQIRFDIAVDDLNNTHRGWYLDDISVGLDTDRDRLPDHTEDHVQAGIAAWNLERQPLHDDATASLPFRGIDVWNAEQARVHVDATHPDWTDLEITAEGRLAGPCTLWDRDAASGPMVLERDLLADCPYTADDLKTHQDWWVNVTDTTPGSQGRLDGASLRFLAPFDRFDADGDDDLASDGEEVDGRRFHGFGDALDTVDAPAAFRSSALSRDVDDDNRLDGYDVRPWIEDTYPTLRDLEGLDGDLRDGITFRVTDNHGVDRDSMVVKVYDHEGESTPVDPAYDADADIWTARWPDDVEVHGFNVTVADVNRNEASHRFDLRIEQNVVQAEFDFVASWWKGAKKVLPSGEQVFGVVASSGVTAPAAAELGGAGATGTAVGGLTATGALTAGGIAAAEYGAIVAGAGIGQAYIDWSNPEMTVTETVTLSPPTYSYVLAGTTIPAGDAESPVDLEFLLAEGSSLSGWERLNGEHGDRWDSPKAFVDWLESLPDRQVTAQPLGDGLGVITAFVDGELFLVTAQHGRISDVDVWEPGPWEAPGNVYMDHVLWMYVQMMEGIHGTDWLEETPPFGWVVAREPREGSDRERQFKAWEIRTINGKVSKDHSPEDSTLIVDEAFWDAVDLFSQADDLTGRDVTETTLAWMSIKLMRFQAEKNAENMEADFYWGPERPDELDECSESWEQFEKRRCDALPGDSGGAADSAPHDGRKWHLIWEDTDNDDAFSVAGEFEDVATKSPLKLLCEAEQGFGEVSGSYNARLPVALQSQSGANVLYIEYAESSTDFQYTESC